MADLTKGLGRIRFLISRSKKIDNDVIKKLESSKDENVVYALKVAKDNGLDLSKTLKKIKDEKGIMTDEFQQKLGFKKVEKSKASTGKVLKNSDSANAPTTAKPKMKILVPKNITCDDEDEDGNEIFLVIGKDGLMGCGVLQQVPAD